MSIISISKFPDDAKTFLLRTTELEIRSISFSLFLLCLLEGRLVLLNLVFNKTYKTYKTSGSFFFFKELCFHLFHFIYHSFLTNKFSKLENFLFIPLIRVHFAQQPLLPGFQFYEGREISNGTDSSLFVLVRMANT